MNDAITTSYKSCNMYKTHGSYLKDMLTQQGHYFSHLYEKTNDYASMTFSVNDLQKDYKKFSHKRTDCNNPYA